MPLIIIFVILFFGYFFLRKAIRRHQFNVFQNEFSAKWEVLSSKEKVELLYAFIGFRYRQQFEDFKDTLSDKVSAGSQTAQGLYAGEFYRRSEETREDCPVFEEISRAELDREFFKHFQRMWSLIRLTGDYDLVGWKVELDYVFSNRTTLAALVIKEKGRNARVQKTNGKNVNHPSKGEA